MGANSLKCNTLSFSLVSILALAPLVAYGAQGGKLKSDAANAVSTDRYVQSLEIDALSGTNKSAARQLATRYLKTSLAEVMKWNLIGAENGDVIAQYNYGMLLLQDNSDSLSRFRALFWLRKAAAAGNLNAKKVLRQVEPAKARK
jgi:TPR repeat protein